MCMRMCVCVCVCMLAFMCRMHYYVHKYMCMFNCMFATGHVDLYVHTLWAHTCTCAPSQMQGPKLRWFIFEPNAAFFRRSIPAYRTATLQPGVGTMALLRRALVVVLGVAVVAGTQDDATCHLEVQREDRRPLYRHNQVQAAQKDHGPAGQRRATAHPAHQAHQAKRRGADTVALQSKERGQ
ncbi:unnamed protein product [Symbiodinium natans]|uniref:Secreted protein n=1 Tax=Symbiodinium natans TaxID=878477 RepID=A0A812ID81_9DINO|nr:unnamed protein product [Symbiodinium natans]